MNIFNIQIGTCCYSVKADDLRLQDDGHKVLYANKCIVAVIPKEGAVIYCMTVSNKAL